MISRKPLKPNPEEERPPQTLAEVTAMESWRFDPLCIAEDDPKVSAPTDAPDKFRIKMLMRDGDRRRETDLLIEKRYAWRGYGAVGTAEEPNQLTMNAELFGRIYATVTVNEGGELPPCDRGPSEPTSMQVGPSGGSHAQTRERPRNNEKSLKLRCMAMPRRRARTIVPGDSPQIYP